jgi:hypothetical protein
MVKVIVFVVLGLWHGLALADLPGVLHWEVERDLETVYKEVYNSLEEDRFFVVFEPNIGKNLAGFSERWGEDYNRNQLQDIRSMVFCNAWYANQVSNLEPQLLALCPLHISLYQKDALTHIVFTRPTHAGAGSNALDLLQELEADVSAAIRQGINAP